MEKKRRQWERHGLYLYYLPPYSPELNRIEILWKHAKHFWRRFAAKNGTDLLDEIQSLMRDFGSKFTINLALFALSVESSGTAEVQPHSSTPEEACMHAHSSNGSPSSAA